MFFAVEEFFLCHDLYHILRYWLVVEPAGDLLARYASIDRVHDNLNFIPELRGVSFNTAKGVSKFVPISIPIDSVRIDPFPLFVIEDGIFFIRTFCFLKGLLRSVDPYACQS